MFSMMRMVFNMPFQRSNEASLKLEYAAADGGASTRLHVGSATVL